MEIILHRRNTIESLKNTPSNYGVEIDIRSYGDNLIISHDPFEYGILFSNWIRNYNHGTLVINLKEDGLEKKILYFLEKYNINTYFFLDQSLPSIINNSREKEIICSARVSEYESIKTALNLKNKVSWIWVDIFTKFPLKNADFIKLKSMKFNLCLVSPELQPNNLLRISDLKKIIYQEKILFDAVCTKFPEQWI